MTSQESCAFCLSRAKMDPASPSAFPPPHLIARRTGNEATYKHHKSCVIRMPRAKAFGNKIL